MEDVILGDVISHGETPERIALLTPTGRDATVAARVLENAGLSAIACADMPALCQLLNEASAPCSSPRRR